MPVANPTQTLCQVTIFGLALGLLGCVKDQEESSSDTSAEDTGGQGALDTDECEGVMQVTATPDCLDSLDRACRTVSLDRCNDTVRPALDIKQTVQCAVTSEVSFREDNCSAPVARQVCRAFLLTSLPCVNDIPACPTGGDAFDQWYREDDSLYYRACTDSLAEPLWGTGCIDEGGDACTCIPQACEQLEGTGPG